eukprot:803002-Rhodomonas_salina.1
MERGLDGDGAEPARRWDGQVVCRRGRRTGYSARKGRKEEEERARTQGGRLSEDAGRASERERGRRPVCVREG